MTNRWLAFGDMVNAACAQLTGFVSIRQLVQSQMVLLVKEFTCSGSKTLTRAATGKGTGPNKGSTTLS